ncbi:MAG: hypothetical protein NTV39_01450 [Candidatus Saccharibacteria bacterium]|nr:hypothetical protein [Candidatus Saccharibacteria bacterium]
MKSFGNSVTKVIFGKVLPFKRLEPLTEDILRAKESEIGATIFGAMAPNEIQREFWYDRRIADRDSWLFHQKIVEDTGVKDVTIHYEVHPNGVLRISSHPNTKNEFIEGQELENFMTATELYRDMVIEKIYESNWYLSKIAA